jgi:hypothetical protein
MDTMSSTDEWKSGTQTLALCMICGGEYPAGTSMCPDCNVSLSMVRRCPNCKRIVSSQHTKCVHCRTAFTNELPIEAVSKEATEKQGPPTLSERARQYRAAAVSIVVFVVVFSAALVFRHVSMPPLEARVVARSYVLNNTQLRRSPSVGSAVVGTLAPGTAVELTGFREGHWMTLTWKDAVAYVPASDLTPPLAVDADEGANALKFYLSEMDGSESVDAAVKAVDYYAQAFPSNPRREELRWVLAERLKALSLEGGAKGSVLRRQANEQYEQLASTNGDYAEKARTAIVKFSSTPAYVASPHKPARKITGLQIVDDSGTHSLTTGSVPREVLVLTRTEVVVRAGRLSLSSAGTSIPGHVAYNVQANGIVAIPAGARCQLKVVSSGSSGSGVSLSLTSIEIGHRVYPVKSTTTELSVGEASHQTANGALTFHLDAPLVLER